MPPEIGEVRLWLEKALRSGRAGGGRRALAICGGTIADRGSAGSRLNYDS